MGIKINKGIFSGAIFTVFGLGYLIASAYIPTLTLLKTLGADFMPRIYGFIMLFLGIAQLSIEFKKAISQQAADNPDSRTAVKRMQKEDKLNILYTFLAIFLYVVLMKYLGFILSSVFYFIAQAIILTPAGVKKKYVLFTLIGVTASLFAFFLFRNVFHINLPTGRIF